MPSLKLHIKTARQAAAVAPVLPVVSFLVVGQILQEPEAGIMVASEPEKARLFIYHLGLMSTGDVDRRNCFPVLIKEKVFYEQRVY